MTPKANPTDAKTIALHFIKSTQKDVTPVFVARTVKQVKQLQESGFTSEQIMYTVDKILSKKANVFSFGYITASINDVLHEREELVQKELIRQQAQETRTLIASTYETQQSEVLEEDESTKRNREKASRIGVQPRLRKKSYFDLFER